jgi:hypothetical protein
MGNRTGRPRGRPRGPWPLRGYRDAIRLAVFRRMRDGRTKLEVIAERLVLRAMSGDDDAIRRLPSVSMDEFEHAHRVDW